MKLHQKILLTILLAFIFSLLFGCGRPEGASIVHETDIPYLQDLYATYNQQYFNDRLPKNPVIDLEEPNPKFMASTICTNAGTTCVIHFQLHFVAAERVAAYTMLHEMCHEKTWGRDTDALGIVSHGKVWRSCMLELDSEGAFREILIDNFKETQ